MNRFIYRALIKDDDIQTARGHIKEFEAKVMQLVNGNQLMTISVFLRGRNLFIYYECIKEKLLPMQIFSGLESILEVWPDEYEDRYWAPMTDVFHMNEPQSVEHWKRKEPVEKRGGYIARLKPEMIASYVYYHYQLQEEQAWNNNKYCIIGLNDNLIFIYEEIPNISEKPLHKGKLDTCFTPSPEAWPELMNPHFEIWEDATEEEKMFRGCDSLLEL